MNRETTKRSRESFTQANKDKTAELIAQSYQRIDASRELLRQTAGGRLPPCKPPPSEPD